MNVKLDVLVFLLVIVSLISCFINDDWGDKIVSPSQHYTIQSSVNRTDRTKDNYAEVIIHLQDNDNVQIQEIHTGAGDANKWALGWTKTGDTIVLQSSDIGNKAWVVSNEKLEEIRLNEHLNRRAKELYRVKYHFN